MMMINDDNEMYFNLLLTVVIYVFTAICQLIFTWIYDDDNDDD